MTTIPELHVGRGQEAGPLTVFPVWMDAEPLDDLVTGAAAKVEVRELPDGATLTGAARCIGEEFGLAEADLTLSSLIARSNFTLKPGTAVTAQARAVLAPRTPEPVRGSCEVPARMRRAARTLPFRLARCCD